MGRIWIRCLSVRQPYANLIAQGRKTVEVRTWEPYWPKDPEPMMNYDGDVLIVSSRKPAIAPAGYAVATVELGLTDPIRRLSNGELEAACLPDGYFKSDLHRAKHFGWRFKRVVRLFEPFPVRGRLGLWWEEVEETALRGAFADAWRRAPAGTEEPKP